MGRRSVDNSTLRHWRALDALSVLQKLECHLKADITFRPRDAQGTQRYHINANGRDFELLVCGPKFFDTRLKRGGGGAVDLVMHLHQVDFKTAADLLRQLAL